jgi:hypothetical protein
MTNGEHSPSQDFNESGPPDSDIDTGRAKMEDATIDGVNRLEAEVYLHDPRFYELNAKFFLASRSFPRRSSKVRALFSLL